MPMPSGISDRMLEIPTAEPSDWYDDMKPMLRDAESRNQFKMPAQSMFKNIPIFAPGADLVRLTVAEMDTYGIERALAGVNSGVQAVRVLTEYPNRFFACYECNSNEGMDEVRWFFPELKFVMRHGGEPWTDLAVKLIPKWPNLYYSTSAFESQPVPFPGPINEGNKGVNPWTELASSGDIMSLGNGSPAKGKKEQKEGNFRK